MNKKNKNLFIKSCRNFNQYELNHALVKSCISGNIDQAKILLTTPEFRFHADIHCGQDSPFGQAYLYNHIELLKFFIFDMNIQKTEHIDKILKTSQDEIIGKMFITRDLKKELNCNLTNNDYENKKFKL
jgi:protein-arginine kinase activator protein McsA